ncbi:M23 family metallopeptidase [Paraburkholderia humisilvae]|uniref:Peptidase M23 domain-containing protein n=1 Tax=Paraburkholderia humisilvae TaxID=627669 RepID=A0A6J5EC90_9BURK|nr:M23 family metallopeptidase [Paraburkholderia humisilvae]CAB3762725.1 hypothetical protein LMG29542_04437 [Paraburkholderia humisilvae]
MIISPPFLPTAGLNFVDTKANPPSVDPLMDRVDKYELAHGIYPIAFDRRWHCGVHLMPAMQNEKVHAIADGVVVAYRVCQHAYDGGSGTRDSHAGFVLLRHTTETGDGRTLTFYSLYMHLLDLESYQSVSADAKRLPEFLRMPAPGDDAEVPPAQPGEGRKVSRKDVLGWTGGCQGQWHLHFEIFMTSADFEAYFAQTQLGRTTVNPALGKDCWGHCYFLIPQERAFRALPPGVDSHHMLSGIAFEPLQTGQNAQPLVVEMYFHKGSKYTNVWSMSEDGSRVLLTPKPICEVDYEYDMYARATKLYAACPSDGYELLRFGRILSEPATLTSSSASTSASIDPAIQGNPQSRRVPSQCATWMRAAFEEGKQGYIDINNPEILKLSDADFPFFMGWQKISEGNSPFNADGLCDIDALKRVVKDTTERQTPQDVALKKEYQKEEVLARYVKSNDAVRRQLRGFICEAPGQWDSTHNEERFRRLKEEGEFYHGNEAGYAAFMKLLTSFQFWEKTGLPAGQKLWFFHPLAFIRHFRRCGWLSLREQIQLLPRRSLPDAGALILWEQSENRFTEDHKEANRQWPRNIWMALNDMFLKYGLSNALRKAHFLGQAFKETGALRSAREMGDSNYFRKMYESYTAEDAAYDFDHNYNWIKKLGFLRGRNRAEYIATRPHDIHEKATSNGNVHPGDGARFKGRGLIHLTWRNGYRDYGKFRSRDYTADPNPELLESDAETAADSAGYFWIMRRINAKADNGVTDQDVQNCLRLVGGADGLAERQQFFRYAYFVLSDAPTMPVDGGLQRQVEDV